MFVEAAERGLRGCSEEDWLVGRLRAKRECPWRVGGQRQERMGQDALR